MDRLARRLEIGVAVTLTIAAVWLRWIAAASAGGLWRDEANTVGLATLPKFADVWSHLQFDSFPIVWLVLVRWFATIFGAANDPAFRWLGFVIGSLLVSALWFHARASGRGFPLMSLALIALSPSVITWGDSMRAYGLGLVVITICASLLWRFVEEPSLSRFVGATLLAVVSVQTLFYNAVLLFAFCAGAFVVCLRRRDLNLCAQVVAIGAIAALSLIPYAETLTGATTWNSLVRIPSYTFEWFWRKLYETLVPGGWWSLVIWVLAFAFAGAAAILALSGSARKRLSNQQLDRTLNGAVVLIVGAVGSYLFLKALAYVTQPWYYLTLLLVVGVAIDTIAGALVSGKMPRTILSLAALGVGMVTLPGAYRAAAEKMTNADIVARQIGAVATASDMIVVNPWNYGVSFDRYYNGKARWTTTPPIPFHAFHRYDLAMRLMQDEDGLMAMRPVTDSARVTLAGGGAVFLVGAALRSAPKSERKSPQNFRYSSDESIQVRWESELASFLQLHSLRADSVKVPFGGGVNRYEKMTVTAYRGWRN